MEIIRNEHEEAKEGRDGRIRTSNRVEWLVVESGDVLATFNTRREAKTYVESRRLGK